MSGEEKLIALHQVRPGELISDIRFRAGGCVAIKGFREGVVPESSPLDSPNTRTFVATNSSPDDPGEIAAALEAHGDGTATLSLDARSDRAAHDVTYLQRFIRNIVEACPEDRITADPATVTLQPETLRSIGFQALETGEYTVPMAA